MMRSESRRQRTRGMALLVVLVVIAVAGTVLAMTARQSCERAVLASRAASDLQARWGQIGCRSVYLPAAERLLDEGREKDAPSPVTARRSIALGGLRFDVVVADEQAKANANWLLARGKSAGLAQSLRRLLADQRRPLKVLPRAGQPRPGLISKVPQCFVSFDQLFDSPAPADLLAAGDECAVAATRRIGCWGSGQVNVRRAERLVMHEMLEGLLSEEELNLLARMRKESPDFALESFLARLEQTRGKEVGEDKETAAKRAQAMKDLRDAMTATSRCHSLWITYRDGLREHHRLDVVQEGDAENDAQEWTFTW